MAFRIRAMTVPDLPLVGVLAGRLIRMHYAFDSERFLKPINPESGYAEWFKTQLDEPDAILLVADHDELGVVGYVYARMEPRSYNELLEACTKLHDILVDERAQRQGIANALLEETFRIAKEKGAPRIVLITAAKNEAAQRFFERAGFRTTMIELTREL